MTASMKKITWCVIYLIKVNYTSYNYTSYKSTWTSPMLGVNATKVAGKGWMLQLSSKNVICK